MTTNTTTDDTEWKGAGYIETYSGKVVSFENPSLDQLAVEDIAWGLSGIGRYAAQSTRFFSVAEHSILGAECFLASKEWGETEAFGFLMHDAHEAYMSDIPAPLKVMCPELKAVEKRLDDLIFEACGLPPRTEGDIIRIMDLSMCKAEKRSLMPKSGDWSEYLKLAIDLPISIGYNEPSRSEVFDRFMYLFEQFAPADCPLITKEQECQS